MNNICFIPKELEFETKNVTFSGSIFSKQYYVLRALLQKYNTESRLGIKTAMNSAPALITICEVG